MTDKLALQQDLNLFQAREEDWEKRRLELYTLLCRQVEAYTHGESSSVPIETAQKLLQSIFYTLALYEKESGIQSNMPLQEVFIKGRQLIEDKIKKAKRLFYLVQNTCLDIPFPCYRDAIQKGLPGFFAAYYPDFAAHETPGDFDYPLSQPCEETGIMWILHFLNCLYWENVFCKRFSHQALAEAFTARGIWGEAVPINVFEVILDAALARRLLGRGWPLSLAIRPGEAARILELLQPLSHDKIAALVEEAVTALCREGQIESEPLKALLRGGASSFCARLIPAIEAGDLGALFPPPLSPSGPMIPLFGASMPDEQMRRLADELTQCRHISDKLLLLHREVHNIRDLIDLMECGCFQDKELYRVFTRMERTELAALLRMGPSCISVNGHWLFPSTQSLPPNAPAWERALYAYMDTLHTSARQEVEDAAEQMILP